MDKDLQESSNKKRKALLRIVDPHRETKALRTSVAGGSKAEAAKAATSFTTMPPPVVPSAAAAMSPSPARLARARE
jgi:hypothetical protein